MNESDKRVRKQFLTMLIASIPVSFVSMALSLSSIPAELSAPAVYGGVFALLAVLIFSFVIYRCAYKKPGTNLLTFFLVSSTIGLILTPILYINQKQSFMNMPYYSVSVLVGFVMNILWLIVLWNMRKVNKRLQTVK